MRVFRAREHKHSCRCVCHGDEAGPVMRGFPAASRHSEGCNPYRSVLKNTLAAHATCEDKKSLVATAAMLRRCGDAGLRRAWAGVTSFALRIEVHRRLQGRRSGLPSHIRLSGQRPDTWTMSGRNDAPASPSRALQLWPWIYQTVDQPLMAEPNPKTWLNSLNSIFPWIFRAQI